MDSLNDRSLIQDTSKVLVCITPQSNSKRLIQKGADVANEIKGEMHILHVQKGDNIFMTIGCANLLESLFRYGSALGGTVHALCGHNVSDVISAFVKENNIDILILGETPTNKFLKLCAEDIKNKISKLLPNVKIITLEREIEKKIPSIKISQIADVR